ncbi:MAG: DeoR/GlpR family DNA-binding transcription regulator [Planctomycetota bacterium]|jgi:DeoR/GlpR family transcriptional regulator of sugar metabolism|nr:DeoR/GlpR family DNA-binding transcription regulator [Planctomycetota bacterium]
MDSNGKAGVLLPEQRRRKILELIQEEGSAKVAALRDLFSVTEPTIRQDLDKLEEDGHVVRRHGGAFLKTIPVQVSTMTLQHSVNMDKKKKLGAKAAAYVSEGDSIILDAGSTITEVANHIENVSNLSVITTALNIALILGSKFNVQVMLVGGEFKPPTLSTTGEQAAKFFDKTIVAGKLFLAATGLSDDGLITYPGLNDIPVKRAMIGASREVFLVADSTKMGKISFAPLGKFELLHHLITDAGISDKYVSLFESHGVDVIIAD